MWKRGESDQKVFRGGNTSIMIVLSAQKLTRSVSSELFFFLDKSCIINALGHF